jgi:uncharacterized protein (DUF427 family)
MNSFEYFNGTCSICGFKGDVRYKNIWIVGSEGIDMCWTCEKAMLCFLNNRKADFIHNKLEKLKEQKKVYICQKN